MTKTLIITAPISEAAAINTKLEQLGYGPNNLSVHMQNGEVINDPLEFANATHMSCCWAADQETIDVIDSLLTTDLASCAVGHQHTQDIAGLFNAMVGDLITIRHKQFNGTQWGWRAEITAASPEFNPGVRAIAIYTDPEHQQYSYTTGAFVQSGGIWATEWNEGKANKTDIHWAVLFAAAREVVGTLPAGQDTSVAYMRFGLPPSEGPIGPTVQPWVQPTGAHDAYAIGSRVTHDNPNAGGAIWVYESKIPANTTQPGRDGTFDRWWQPIQPA